MHGLTITAAALVALLGAAAEAEGLAAQALSAIPVPLGVALFLAALGLYLALVRRRP